MIETWILSKLEPYRKERLILLRDPQRMIRSGARAVDGWAQEHGYTVLFCTGNLALREMYEPLRGHPDGRVLLVDRSRGEGGHLHGSLFYPDLQAAAGRRTLVLSLREYLMEQTGDVGWPALVEERNFARLALANLDGMIEAHGHLRQVSSTRFTDSDLYKILLGAALHINPFVKLGPNQVRRVCLEQHDTLDELNKIMPPEVRQVLRSMIESAPPPFSRLLDGDPEPIIRAFTLACLLHQHKLDYGLLLANLDPALHAYKSIDPNVLNGALQDQLSSDPDRTLADVQQVEAFLKDDPKRLAFLLHEQLHIDDYKAAVEVLKHERLSGLVRSLALASLLVDLIQKPDWSRHQKILKLLEKQEQDAQSPVTRRPTEQWVQLLAAYRRAVALYELTDQLKNQYLDLKVAQPDELDFARFDQLWNERRLNRLDFYVSDLERMLRVGDILPVPHNALWPAFETRWNQARQQFKEAAGIVDQIFQVINRQFQDLYHKHYTRWIGQPDSPVVFTHQFLPRMLKAHWDPKSGRKAVVLVFDGLRTDAWDELVRPVLEERYEIVESRPGSALIPTETELSRKAISAGCLPTEFPIKGKRELDLLAAWLKTNLGITPQFEVLRDDDTVASGMTVRYRSKELDYIVFNFTDDNLHHNNQDLAFIYNTTVREIIRQDVRSVLRELPTDALVFITSDHGFTAMPAQAIEVGEQVISDPSLVKFRAVRAAHNLAGPETEKTVGFDIRALKIPIAEVTPGRDPVQKVLFARPGYIFQRASYHATPDRFSHGGLSLAECMVPMVVMGPRKVDLGLLSLGEVRQVGSMLENEPLEMEIQVRASQMLFDGLPFSLSFSLQEIPERKEFFSGIEKTYRLQWKAGLPEITATQREDGYLVLPVTVVLTYTHNGKVYKISRSTDLNIRLDTTRLRRRLDSKLDLLMGKVPKELKG